MDDKWFKSRLKAVGKNAGDIAMVAGRSRSNVSHILNGHQRMNLEWAQAFAQVLNEPVATILERAGSAQPALAQQLAPGFAESDAAAWIPQQGQLGENIETADIAKAFGARAGVEIWRVKSSAMALAGMMQGDFMLVDTHQAERVRAGDVVIAQVYNPSGATTVLRRYAPPVLIAHSADPADWRTHVVDGVNVVVMGKVVATWRLAA